MQIGNVSYHYLITARDRRIKTFLKSCERFKQNPSATNLKIAMINAKECKQAMEDINNEVKRIVFVMDMLNVDGEFDKVEELSAELNSLQNEGLFQC